MSADPRLAFVVPAFNAEATIRATLESLITQTRPDWEAIVVDDGSVDGTAAAASSVRDARVRVHRQQNRGLAGARNEGLVRIAAPAVCFLDADDTVEPEYAERMLAVMGTGADAAACAYRYVGSNLEDLKWVVPVGAQDLRRERFLEFNPLVVGGVCVRVNAAREAAMGGEVFRTHLRVHEDWDLWLRMASAGARWAEPVQDPLFNYRLRPDSMSTDLGVMWRAGLDLISSAAGERERGGPLRGWTVRNLARAVARGDAPLIAQMTERIGGLRETDVGVLAGSLRWAFCRQELVGPAEAMSRAAAWRAQTERLLHGSPVLRELSRRMEWGTQRWEDAVSRAASRLREGDSLVIYGLGRNGHEALAAAQRLGVWVYAVDDSPAAHADVPRLRADELTDRHVVLVTPDDRSPIVQRLATLGVGRVELPEAAA